MCVCVCVYAVRENYNCDKAHGTFEILVMQSDPTIIEILVGADPPQRVVIALRVEADQGRSIARDTGVTRLVIAEVVLNEQVFVQHAIA